MIHDDPVLTLSAHHQHLDATFDDLVRAVETGDRGDLRNTWADFARELRSHLAYEERAFVPGFERDAPHEAAIIRREHAQIQATLVDLEARLGRQALDRLTVKDFIATLRRHAQDEEATIYAWASSHRPATGWEVLPPDLGQRPISQPRPLEPPPSP